MNYNSLSANVINAISNRHIPEFETNMIFSFFRDAERSPIPNQIYGILVAAARDPDLFRSCKIDDSVMGRFDMLSLHVYLFARRMRHDELQGAEDMVQEVFDLYVDGVEIALREIGIGDTTVPKRKKKMIHSFYGMIEEFDPALDGKNMTALEEAVSKRFYKEPGGVEAGLLARYISANSEHLANVNADEMLHGQLHLLSIGEIG